MRKALTAKTIDALKPKERRYEVFDALCPGFSVRVTVEGHKVFYVRFRYGVKQCRMKLGQYPRLTLSEARDRANEALRLVDDGVNPLHRRRQADMRVEAICEDFINQYARPRNRSWREAERILKRELVPTFGQSDIRTLTRPDILSLIDGAVARGSAYQANRIHSHLRKLFNWCLERGILDASPVMGLRAPTREQARDRVLSDAEITALLKACAGEPYPYRQFVPLLLATAQRRGELTQMRWSEINLDTKEWVIPAHLSKNGKPHAVPLSAFALNLLAELPRYEGCDIVFTTNGRVPINGFTKAIQHMHDISGTSNWRFHDLRRTAASGMARAAVPPHVIEKVLNHISGTISGVAAVYNRYGYDAEKRGALEQWGERLAELARRSPYCNSQYVGVYGSVNGEPHVTSRPTQRSPAFAASA
ncbi:MAG: tyrosine-type recombinase/integrase [Sphingomonadales bacterium]|nr:tyrosine-type recombinase/integrase [Sphingomonadales bacterium]MDE2171469.1 tyrosine-type recombinase/integrase [Sphingomonadales bacterium]